MILVIIWGLEREGTIEALRNKQCILKGKFYFDHQKRDKDANMQTLSQYNRELNALLLQSFQTNQPREKAEFVQDLIRKL